MLFLFAALLTSSAFVTSQDADADLVFHNDRELVEEETGGVLQLQSHGRLTKIVDLDEAPGIKVRNCNYSSFVLCLVPPVS